MKKLCRKSNKIKFDTHEQAAIRAGKVLLTINKPYLRTYKCAFCNKWHLTSKDFI